MKRGRRILLYSMLGLWSFAGCSLLPKKQSECFSEQPCPHGQLCDKDTATCQAPPAAVWLPGDSILLGNWGRLAMKRDGGATTDEEAETVEEPVHLVTLSPFFLDPTEVTVSAYRACWNLGSGSCTEPSTRDGLCNWTSQPGPRENHPINCVTHDQAAAFCAFAGRRLPTEAEWEYAARGGTSSSVGSKFPWGAALPGAEPGAGLCWRRTEGTCEVGLSPLTRLGLSEPQSQAGFADLAGNVDEWTATTFCERTDGSGVCTDGVFVVRGGSFSAMDAGFVRSARRWGIKGIERRDGLGFRCVLDNRSG